MATDWRVRRASSISPEQSMRMSAAAPAVGAISTIVRRGLAVTVIVLDNKGYGTERLLLEGSFNDINPWQYQLLPQVLGGGTGYEVRTEGEFDAAIGRAIADTTGMSIIRVHIGIDDRSTTLDRLAAGMARKIKS